MYVPAHFRVDDLQEIYRFIQANSFATLVTQQDGAPFASHLPLILDAQRAEHGVLLGHMARANPQWRDLRPGLEVLTIFQGGHTYVSPSWYVNPQNVPTWNYMAVHAYGVPRLIEDHDELYTLLKSMVQTFEAPLERPWAFDLPGPFVEGLMRAIVGFELRITRLEAKFKLGQNRAEADRASLEAALQQSPHPDARRIGEAMAALRTTGTRSTPRT